MKERLRDVSFVNNTCPICKKAFKRKDHVQRHYLELHMFQPNQAFECCRCSQKFKRRYLMENHERICSGPNGQTHQCWICHMRYKNKGKLVSHLNEVHNVYNQYLVKQPVR